MKCQENYKNCHLLFKIQILQDIMVASGRILNLDSVGIKLQNFGA